MKKLTKTLMATCALAMLSTAMMGCNNTKKYDINITFWHTMGQNLQGLLDRFITEFQAENPTIGITHAAQGGYDDLEEKLSAAIPAGTTPTMAYCYPDHVAEYMESNAILQLDEFIESETLGFTEDEGLVDDIISTYWQEGQEYKKPGVFSVPYSKSTEILFYNETIFKDKEHHASGQEYAVPATWEAMEKLMEEAKADYPDKTILGYDSDANMFITLCEQYGIPYTSLNKETGVGSADFNNAAAKAMVTKLVDWVSKGYLTTQALSSGAYTSTQFKEGSLLMSIGSTGGTSYNYSSNFDIGLAEVPAPDMEHPFDFGGTLEKTNHIIMQGPSICFFKKSTQAEREAAWKFYKFIVKAMNSASWSVKSGYSPIRQSSFESDAMKDYLADTTIKGSDGLIRDVVSRYDELTTRYYVSPAFHGSSTARNQVDGILANVALGTKDLNTAFADAYSRTVFAING